MSLPLSVYLLTTSSSEEIGVDTDTLEMVLTPGGVEGRERWKWEDIRRVRRVIGAKENLLHTLHLPSKSYTILTLIN